MFKTHKVERQIGGRTLQIETGKLAKQAHGAVTVTYGETIVLVAAVAGPCRENIDYFPLTVDYREKDIGSGQVPRRLYETRRPADHKGNSYRPHDRPANTAVVPGWLFRRGAGAGDGAQRRSGK